MGQTERRIADAIDTADLWKRTRRRVPPIVTEYFRGGADAEITLRSNVRAFQEALTTARGARSFPSLDLGTTCIGHQMAIPFFISPVGSLRALGPMADAVASRVAGEFGTVMTLSTLSGTPMEDVAAASRGDCWFQLYLCGGRDTAVRGIERARRAGFTALVLTIDTGVAGMRAMHARMKPMEVARSFRGLGFGERLGLALAKSKLAPQMLYRPSWLASHLRDGGLFDFVNVVDAEGSPMPYTDIGAQLEASVVTWEDLKWIREAWGEGPLVIKGVHDAEDARRAEALGATGVVWSNHGGRQQDRVPPALHIVAREMPLLTDSRLDFMMDGGIRNGTDVLIALSHGLKAVGLGRVTAAGLGAGGHAGLTRAFEIVKSELERAMRLVGVGSIDEIHAAGPELRRTSLLAGDGHLPPMVF